MLVALDQLLSFQMQKAKPASSQKRETFVKTTNKIEIPDGCTPGRIHVFGENAFSCVAANSTDQPGALAACSTHFKGKIVALGHGALLDTGLK